MKNTARDIWAIPPGGFDTKPVRRWIRPTIAATLVLLLGVGGGALYSSMKRSTAVSTQDAIAEFRAGAEAAPDAGDRGSSKSKATKKNESKEKRARSKSSTASGGSGSVAAGTGDDTQGATASTGGTNEPAGSSSRSRRAAVASPDRPQDGVYTWDIEGYERGPGVERRLPRRSHRIISYEGRNWVEHHIFSEQKEQWFHLQSSDQGVAVSEVRNRVEMGPVEVDRTVVYNPPAFVSRWPFQLNQTWQGSWDGRTSGSYTGKTIDHGTLVIGGTKVEVWVTEVKMQMRGEMDGTAITRSWVAPEYNMVVKQYQETSVKSGPGDYYSEWEGQVLSLEPQR